MKKENIKFEFTISGFIIALILVGLCFSGLALLTSELQSNYGVGGSDNNTLGKYNQTAQLIANAETIRNATDIQQKSGVLDVIGGYFSSGYSALKISLGSVDLFGNLLDDASEDVEVFALVKGYLFAFLLIAIFVGVVIAALLKRKV